jgi:DNA-binding LacI/PurR family transcriptional regulator
MGYIAGEALLKIIENNGEQEKYKLVIQPKLVIRESTVHTIGHSNI